MSNVDKHQVTERIKKAFAATRYPGDARLALDPSGDDPESNQVANYFKGKRWQQIDHASLEGYIGDESAVLFFMSPDAFRYYLPAFMLISIEHFNESDVLPRSVISALTLPDRTERLFSHQSERIQGFSPEQVEAIRDYLEYMASAYGDHFLGNEPRIAIESYWLEASRRKA